MTKTAKPKRPRLPRRQLVAAGLILAVALGATLAIIRSVPAANGASSAAAPTSLSSCQKATAKDYRCYATFFSDEMYDKGKDAAFADLKSAYSSDPYVKAECHQLAHIMGRTAYKKYGSLEAAYAQGDSFCWSGFYHGAIEQAIADLGPDKIKQQAPDICESFAKKKPYSFDHFNCVHGLGHGLMTVAAYDLPKSLELCDVLRSDWERQSCYGGVFMENVMVDSRGGHSIYFKDDQPLYPCTMVKTQYKEQCYLMQTSQILSRNGYDFGKTFQECAKADTGFVDTCYRSLGRDASGSTVSDKDRTVAICRLATDSDGLHNCMLGAERDFVSYYHSNKQALALCDAFGGAEVTPCKQDVAQYYQAF